MDNNEGFELIGFGRSGRVMLVGNMAVKTPNVWAVPKDASPITTHGWKGMNELNKDSIKHIAILGMFKA